MTVWACTFDSGTFLERRAGLASQADNAAGSSMASHRVAGWCRVSHGSVGSESGPPPAPHDPALTRPSLREARHYARTTKRGA
jgi:hypothetical protein